MSFEATPESSSKKGRGKSKRVIPLDTLQDAYSRGDKEELTRIAEDRPHPDTIEGLKDVRKLSMNPATLESLEEIRKIQNERVERMKADAEKAEALAKSVKEADFEIIEESADQLTSESIQSAHAEAATFGKDVERREQEAADAKSNDTYYAKIAERLSPSDLQSYKAIYGQYEALQANLEGAGFLEKRKLNARKAALEKELAPYWDKIQRYDEFAALKEPGAKEAALNYDLEVFNQLLSGNRELVKKAIEAKVPGLTAQEDIDAFAANLLEEQNLEGVINSAKGFTGFFKRAIAENKLKNLRAQLVPLKNAVMSSRGTTSTNLDARRMGRAAQ